MPLDFTVFLMLLYDEANRDIRGLKKSPIDSVEALFKGRDVSKPDLDNRL
jgi:hypothetical protein